jgi:hypothetical protein
MYVNAISPGGFVPHPAGSLARDYSGRTPLGRDSTSPASGYITGHNFVVEGGFSICP